VQNLQKIQTFFVREVGRGSGVLERSLEITEVLRGGGRRSWKQEAGLHIFWKKVPGKFICGLRPAQHCS